MSNVLIMYYLNNIMYFLEKKNNVKFFVVSGERINWLPPPPRHNKVKYFFPFRSIKSYIFIITR